MRRLASTGLLLLQDSSLPNVATLVTGEPVRGSWWGHSQSHDIFAVDRRLASHPDVLSAKLIAGKVTFVHRGLWPALLTVGTSRSTWQVRGLPASARSLLKRAEDEGPVLASGASVKELERRLLARTEEQHTETGAHRIAVESWTTWARREKIRPLPSLVAATTLIDNAVLKTGGTSALLPWNRPRRRSPSRPRAS